jgi:hypothetical protein
MITLQSMDYTKKYADTHPQQFGIELITHAEEIKHRVFIYMPFKPLFTSLLK